ncbi:helix-turn-helix transcriptional regulator [Tessaracoccus sp. MC1679]|uniref:helix-turn-helix domain-containing protein n=2 Tax=unclassified Tessaracoccus TaxID=2635419 RepID=UPI001C71E109|nr:helix-turn-helix transcriptional regulator [Tessaracoccus sp. MC1679]
MIRVRLDYLLVDRGLSVQGLAEAVGITAANVSVLKNGRAKAVRFSTLEAMCRVLDCQPGEILEFIADEDGDSADSVNRRGAVLVTLIRFRG